MPITPQRRPLGVLSPDIITGRELNPIKRAQLQGARAVGASWSTIQAVLKTPISTARDTIIKASTRVEHTSLPCSGRPTTYTARDERTILRLVRRKPKITYAGIKRETGLDLSRDTFRRILEKHGVSNTATGRT
jgi:transposase